MIARVERKSRKFDPSLKSDVDVYRKFVINRGWGAAGCPFVLEFPFENIPAMIENKIVRHVLKVEE